MSGTQPRELVPRFPRSSWRLWTLRRSFSPRLSRRVDSLASSWIARPSTLRQVARCVTLEASPRAQAPPSKSQMSRNLAPSSRTLDALRTASCRLATTSRSQSTMVVGHPLRATTLRLTCLTTRYVRLSPPTPTSVAPFATLISCGLTSRTASPLQSRSFLRRKRRSTVKSRLTLPFTRRWSLLNQRKPLTAFAPSLASNTPTPCEW
mmetsp:Transcript_24531/g.74808  ORF Transcript_24531/g.74808 Transcript_24531/m.74808 type:complete len:207 (+) Transcript_24531:1948-2568(+)